MRACKSLILLKIAALLLAWSHAKPLEDASKIDTELSDLNAMPKNKTAVVNGAQQDSAELTQHAYPHRDEDQLNTATNLVLANNYKYDVEILESGDSDNDDEEQQRIDSRRPVSAELEENFKGHGIYDTDADTFMAENIEVTPVDVQSTAISENHMMLSIVLVVLALVSVGLYAALVIWRSHLEQRYGMRERLVNRDIDDEGVDDVDYHVAYPHTLSPYAPTTTIISNNGNSLSIAAITSRT